MSNKMPEPQTLVDSIADGAIELAEGPVRAAVNTAAVAQTFATQVKANMDDFKTRMPQDPTAIPDCAVRGAAQTVGAGISFVKGIGMAITDTLDAVHNQIKRVTG